MRHWQACVRTSVAAAVVLAFAAVCGLPAVAEEGGQWRGKGVVVVVDKLSMKVEDRANHTVAATEFDGLVFNEEGKPFLDKARYQIVAMNDAGVLRAGYNIFTDSEGAKVFAKYTVTESKPPEHNGTFELTGGTGKYEGITGTGTFRIVYINDRVGWNEFSADYAIPTPPPPKPGSAKPAAGGTPPPSK